MTAEMVIISDYVSVLVYLVKRVTSEMVITGDFSVVGSLGKRMTSMLPK